MELDVVVRVNHSRPAWIDHHAQRTDLGLIAKHGIADTAVARARHWPQRRVMIAGDDSRLTVRTRLSHERDAAERQDDRPFRYSHWSILVLRQLMADG
jgi:hypothetical protein